MPRAWPSTAATAGAIVAPALAVTALPGAVTDALIYQREAILDGELWRTLTAHWVHLDTTHLLINMAGLAAVVLVLGRFLSPVRLLLATALGGIAVSLGLFLLAPQLDWYVGLSGVVSGIWAAAALHGSLRRDWLGFAAIALLAAKLAWEQVQGAPVSLTEEMSDAVIVDAHLYGMLGGLLAVPLARLWRTAD
ncbi:rhombosortase [Methylonatrum kenyense]|uniref:rhombosortase n=1 Tax=Methylonatrum kenyense TaxID=455253 RepID=UPI00202B9183|nr:rhombosortase [Methylonatrum kenyense]MCK8515661.1 rhombosortase [Methylonatrum kenyense]